jgi:hypothetical protein
MQRLLDIYQPFKPLTIKEMKQWTNIHGIDYHASTSLLDVVRVTEDVDPPDNNEQRQITEITAMLKALNLRCDVSIVEYHLMHNGTILYRKGAIVVKTPEETIELEIERD